jgi:hypothetical protein
VYNGGPWGHWSARSNCAVGTKATGFYLKVDPNHHTGINGIRIICSDGSEVEPASHE